MRHENGKSRRQVRVQAPDARLERPLLVVDGNDDVDDRGRAVAERRRITRLCKISVDVRSRMARRSSAHVSRVLERDKNRLRTRRCAPSRCSSLGHPSHIRAPRLWVLSWRDLAAVRADHQPEIALGGTVRTLARKSPWRVRRRKGAFAVASLAVVVALFVVATAIPGVGAPPVLSGQTSCSDGDARHHLDDREQRDEPHDAHRQRDRDARRADVRGDRIHRRSSPGSGTTSATTTCRPDRPAASR